MENGKLLLAGLVAEVNKWNMLFGKKNRAGQSYLYKKNGMESEIIEIKVIHEVYISDLQRALDMALLRYPYLADGLIEKDGDFYYYTNNNPVIVRNSIELKPLGSSYTNQHLIDINFIDKTIFISFHHALVDGEGIKPFIETLLFYYCNYRYNMEIIKFNGINLANEKMLPDETKDPFTQQYDHEDKDFPEFDRNGFVLPECENEYKNSDFRFELLIDHDAFLSFMKKYNATPSIAVASIMNQAIKNLFSDFDKPIICNSALSMRKILGCDNTFKNCVKSIMLLYTHELSNKTLIEQALEFRKQMTLQRDSDYIKKSANDIIKLFEKLDQLPTYKEKQKMMSFFEKMLVHTYFLSYIGQFNLGNNGKYIESIHLYNSGVTGLGINLIATDKYFCICFKQSFSESKYVEEFMNVLGSYNIGYKYSGQIAFLTPTDDLIPR